MLQTKKPGGVMTRDVLTKMGWSIYATDNKYLQFSCNSMMINEIFCTKWLANGSNR